MRLNFCLRGLKCTNFQFRMTFSDGTSGKGSDSELPSLESDSKSDTSFGK